MSGSQKQALQVTALITGVVISSLLLLMLMLIGCTSNRAEVKGVLTAYYTVDEYTAPLAVIVDRSGNNHVIAIMCNVVTRNGAFDSELLKNMLNGTLYNVEIVVTYGEKGKSVIIDGQKTEVYQAYQINVIQDNQG